MKTKGKESGNENDKAIQKLLDDCREKCSGDKNYIFRGMLTKRRRKPAGIWSTLYDEYKKKGLWDRQLEPFTVEKQIVERAKRHFPSNSTDLEILTDLRHYEEKLALIDFSEDLHVALFFACYGEYDRHGELIVLKRPDIKSKIDYCSKDIYAIKPTINQISQKRVIAQSSIFVHVPRGYIEKDHYETIIVNKALKKPALDYLRKYYGISVNTIYNDLIGFIVHERKSDFVEFYLGVRERELVNHETAIERYDKAIELNPQFSEAYYNRGKAKRDLGRHEEALEDYNKAIELDPGNSSAYNNRGAVKQDLGRHEEALEDYNKAIELDPGNGFFRYSRGEAKFKLGRFEEAIEDCDRAIELDPEDGFFRCNRGYAKSTLEKHEEALEDYNRAIELDPENGFFRYSRGKAKFKLGRFEEAIEDYDRAIELDPEDGFFRYSRGEAKFKLGRFEEAIEDYDRAIELDPTSWISYYNRGEALKALARDQEAQKDFDTAERLREKQEQDGQAGK